MWTPVYAYLMSREPMQVANRNNALTFPFNIRQTLTFWNLVNLPGEAQAADDARSANWNRGQYLVDALAHCGECHTPRNVMQGMQQNKYLQGSLLEGIMAPDITREGLARMGFDAPLLAGFMASGISAQGAMTNQMFDVVHFSTQYMTGEDLNALSAYLFDLDAAPDKSVPPPRGRSQSSWLQSLPPQPMPHISICVPLAMVPKGRASPTWLYRCQPTPRFG